MLGWSASPNDKLKLYQYGSQQDPLRGGSFLEMVFSRCQNLALLILY